MTFRPPSASPRRRPPGALVAPCRPKFRTRRLCRSDGSLRSRRAAAESEGAELFIGFLREDPSTWPEAGVSKEEAASSAWLAFAGRGYADLLVVSGVTGRVFTCEKDSPPLHLVASSILEWIEAYADRVEAGQYRVEEGFGEWYLARDEAMF